MSHLEVFDSSNAVLGMAFTHTHTHTQEKVIAFCTAETNFVLHNKQNKNKEIAKSRLKTSKVVKKGGKKLTQTKFEKGRKKLT